MMNRIERATEIKLKKNLWDHQYNALRTIHNYLDSCKRNRRCVDIRYALINMPTGTGKTGVMASSTCLSKNIKFGLILAPRSAICDEIHRSLNSKFWKVSKLDGLKRQNRSILVNTKDGFPSVPEQGIYIMTIQKFYSERRGPRSDSFNDFLNRLDILFLDEGHVEPSIKWSEALRSVRAPKVIFTATPYRNDLKAFDIDKNFVYVFPFHKAVCKKIVRKVKIIDMDKARSASDFVERFRAFCESKYGDTGEWPKTIIRCASVSGINSVVSEFSKIGIDCCSIHESFKSDGPRKFRKVPSDLSNRQDKIWIHQYKLMEGIDDSQFRIVAFFDALSSTREIVQQIGRVIRNPKGKADQAIVLDFSGGTINTKWNSYLKFDRELKDGSDIEHMSFQWTIKGPDLAYIDKSFRSRFKLEEEYDEKLQSKVQVPLRTRIFTKDSDFDFNTAIGRITEGLKSHDCKYRRVQIAKLDEITAEMFVYERFKPSPVLAKDYYMEGSLGVCVVVELQKSVYFCDSLGATSLQGLGGLTVVSSDAMKRLFCDKKGTRLTEVNLKNSLVDKWSLRSKRISAFEVEGTVSPIDDAMHFCTGATGYFERQQDGSTLTARQYINLSNGRVSESSEEFVSFRTYIDWLKGLERRLHGTQQKNRTFKRYAPEFGTPKRTKPLHILLDCMDVAKKIMRKDDAHDGSSIIEDLAAIVRNDSFSLRVGEEEFQIGIEFNKKGRYILKCPNLDKAFVMRGDEGVGLIAHLNREQLFRVVPEEQGFIYSNGSFFKPGLNFGQEMNLGVKLLLRSLVPCDGLQGVQYEKIDENENCAFSNRTLFGIVKRPGKKVNEIGKLMSNKILLVCDDKGANEGADFFLSSPSRVALIHCKASKTWKPFSATALQEILGQVMKNTKYLNAFNSQKPPNINEWNKKWKLDGYTHRRIIFPARSKKNGEALWNEFKLRLADPSCHKEIWVILGNILSKKTLRMKLKKNDPASIQVIHLLYSAQAAASAVGANLKIFCSK